jgi:hypothetical protein
MMFGENMERKGLSCALVGDCVEGTLLRSARRPKAVSPLRSATALQNLAEFAGSKTATGVLIHRACTRGETPRKPAGEDARATHL